MIKGLMPPETFRVYPWGPDSAIFFAVFITPDIVVANSVARMIWGNRPRHDIVACCISCDCASEPDMVGALVFAQTHMGSGIVAHEISHAAFRTVEHAGTKVRHWRRGQWRRRLFGALEESSLAEETYCEVVERLSRQFWREVYARGLQTPAA